MPKTLSSQTKIHLGVTCVVIWNDQILLLERRKDESRFPNQLIGPGGFVDLGEDILNAAKRELFEETGLNINTSSFDLRYIGISEHNDKNESFVLCVFRVKLADEPKLRESGEGKLVWIKINDAWKNKHIFPGFKFHLKHTLDDSKEIMYANIEFRDSKIFKVNSIVNE